MTPKNCPDTTLNPWFSLQIKSLPRRREAYSVMRRPPEDHVGKDKSTCTRSEIYAEICGRSHPLPRDRHICEP